jgi:Nucleotidyl transferase of unknown function (DUF2204)
LPGVSYPGYGQSLRWLVDEGVPFLAGGALVLAAYAGVRRDTKDLDLFVLERDSSRVLDVLARAGFRIETPYPHWLGKARADEHCVDVIFSSGNGVARVDEEWFEHASRAVVFGIPVLLCPPEETIWSKAFVMERERFDGADVAHLLLACSSTLDWNRLLRRFGDHWRVLLSHLVLFGYVYPAEAARIPRAVLDELFARFGRPEGEREHGFPDERSGHVCRGPFLSREQYLTDLARGWQDGRLTPNGSMSAEDIAIWTEAIGRK